MKCTLYFQNLTFSSELYIYLNGTAEMNNFFLWVMFYSFFHLLLILSIPQESDQGWGLCLPPDPSIAKEV